ncbi:hypothetical protein GCM10010174_25860 [Kutzneria viridogrisea]|uniref:Uncharacterized protein n=1 Tax=Kutzneria viridogrisea TaxID=47990 RepID=A0ABR6BS91_9PSEU|nr:hypothetical protein [Kutzneria viridogrisea]
MDVDGVRVDQFHRCDTELVWSFTPDDHTYFEVVLLEEDNNLRAWRATLHDDYFRPVRWLLPEDPDRQPLDEYGLDTWELVTEFVRDQITERRNQCCHACTSR